MNVIEQAQSEITEAIEGYYEDARNVYEQSMLAVRANLKYGEKMPQHNFTHGDEYKAKEAEARNSAFALIKGACNRARNEVMESMTAPIGSDAVNTIQLLSLRGTVTQADVDAAQAAYGSNYQAALAIADIAKQNGLTYKDERLSYLERIDKAEAAAIGGIPARFDASNKIKHVAALQDVNNAIDGKDVFGRSERNEAVNMAEAFEAACGGAAE